MIKVWPLLRAIAPKRLVSSKSFYSSRWQSGAKSRIKQLFIFGIVCVKSNLCREGAGEPGIPCSLQRRKKRNLTPRGQRSPLSGYRGSCARAGLGSQVSALALLALPWRLPAQPSICKAVEGDPRGPLQASLAKHWS